MKYLMLFEKFSAKLNVNKILNSYLETALWTEEEKLKEDEDESFDDMYGEADDDIRDIVSNTELSFDNISDDSKIKAYMDIKKFLEIAGNAVEGIDEIELGHDIWLTRNHHGAGFFDRGYDEEVEARLTQAAHQLGEETVYIDDNYKIQFSKI